MLVAQRDVIVIHAMWERIVVHGALYRGCIEKMGVVCRSRHESNPAFGVGQWRRKDASLASRIRLDGSSVLRHPMDRHILVDLAEEIL